MRVIPWVLVALAAEAGAAVCGAWAGEY